MTRLCNFCQKETIYVPLIVSPKHQFEVYYCYDCEAEYVDNTGGIHLYTTLNGTMYRWSIEVGGTIGRLWRVGEPGIPGERPNRKMRLIKNFKEHIPEITPQNIQEKLKLILVFM